MKSVVGAIVGGVIGSTLGVPGALVGALAGSYAGSRMPFGSLDPQTVEVIRASGLLGRMMQLRTLYQQRHWNATDYQTHLLFERLYKSLEEDIDALAELLLADGGSLSQGDVTATIGNDPQRAEDGIVALAAQMAPGAPPAFNNFLLSLTEHRRRAIYLLRQARVA